MCRRSCPDGYLNQSRSLSHVKMETDSVLTLSSNLAVPSGSNTSDSSPLTIGSSSPASVETSLHQSPSGLSVSVTRSESPAHSPLKAEAEADVPSGKPSRKRGKQLIQ